MDRARKTATVIVAKSTSSNVGRSVTFELGVRRVTGTVVEDRGPLGVGGKPIVRVKINSETEVELPKDLVTFAT